MKWNAAGLFFFILRLFIGGLFIYAAISKLMDPLAFAVDIQNYRILPALLSKTAALVIPPLELISGTFLIFGVWRMEAALWISLMMAGFLVGDIQALARGLDINCGCFGKEPTKLSFATMLRNLGLLLGIGFVFFQEWRLRKKGS